VEVCEGLCKRALECFPNGTSSECVSACLSGVGNPPCERNQAALDACVAAYEVMSCDDLLSAVVPIECEYVCLGDDLCDGIDCNDGESCTQDVCDPVDGGCDYTAVEDGTSCDGGICQIGQCVGPFPCTEEGIREAIEFGIGPHAFACDGPTTVTSSSEIVVDNDVTLDGEGRLTVDAQGSHRVFSVARDVTAELRGITVTGGFAIDGAGGIRNMGTLTLINSTVSGNVADGTGCGIWNGGGGELTVMSSTVSHNSGGDFGGGIDNEGVLTLNNSTISGNAVRLDGGGIFNNGRLTSINSTVTGNDASRGSAFFLYQLGPQTLTILANTLIDGDCAQEFGEPVAGLSKGHNIESPGDTCGFDANKGDLFDVTAEQLNLAPLADNGGPTETHSLLPGSVAIDAIPAEDCVDADGEPLMTDQRGEPRPVSILGPEPKCDVGAFEVQQLCFQDDECSPLICCHLGSPFEVGTCQSQSVCDQLQGGR
jgi:hypothetical protein